MSKPLYHHTLKSVADEVSPELILESLHQIYEAREVKSKVNYAAAAICYFGAKSIRKLFPGHELDVHDPDKTIGERSARLHAKNPHVPLGVIIDSVIADRVCEGHVRNMKKNREEKK